MASFEGELSAKVEAALQDPNLHTDSRLLLRRELIEMLGHHRSHEVARRATPESAPHLDDGELSRLVDAALSDPNLHTDERLALSRSVAEMLHRASKPK